MDSVSAKKSGRKLRYEKPRLQCVELAADEVLAQGCKLATHGNNYENPIGCCQPTACVSSGS